MKTEAREPTHTQARRKRVPTRHTRAELVRRLRAQMPRLVERYGVKSLGVFGSYMRGNAKPRSDFDVLVEFDAPGKTLHKWVELQSELQDTLGVKVDLVENENLKPYIGKRILSEVIWLRHNGKDLRARLPRRATGVSMPHKREYLDYLADIARAMEKTMRFVAGVTFDEFILNEEKIAAVERAVEIIGKAVKNIPADVRGRHPDVKWKAMAGMRDKLTHGYFAVNLPKLCEVATDYIPQDLPHVTAAREQELERRRAEEETKKATPRKRMVTRIK
jgi:uncharacterized protein with HEPN domain/predicted nucleotidyltransferase